MSEAEVPAGRGLLMVVTEEQWIEGARRLFGVALSARSVARAIEREIRMAREPAVGPVVVRCIKQLADDEKEYDRWQKSTGISLPIPDLMSRLIEVLADGDTSITPRPFEEFATDAEALAEALLTPDGRRRAVADKARSG